MSDIFDGPRLKIERAKQHIRDLDGRIATFQAGGLHHARVYADSQTGNDVIEISPIQSLPDDLSLIVGDALHNLKSALDITINTIVLIRRNKRDDFCRFPIRASADELVAAVKGGEISKASRAVADFIVNVIKPYQRGNDALWALHRLNVEDKHRLLIPTLRLDVLRGLCYEDERGQQELITGWGITKGRTVRHETFRKNVKIVNQGQTSLHVLFDVGIGSTVDGQEINGTLHHLAEVVSGTIEGIRTVFLDERI